MVNKEIQTQPIELDVRKLEPINIEGVLQKSKDEVKPILPSPPPLLALDTATPPKLAQTDLSPKADSAASFGNILADNQMDFLGDYLEGLAKGEIRADDTDPEKIVLKDRVGSLESEMETLKKAKDINEAAASKTISQLQEQLDTSQKQITALEAELAKCKTPEKDQKINLEKETKEILEKLPNIIEQPKEVQSKSNINQEITQEQ